MVRFKFTALDRAGGEHSGVTEAESPAGLAARLREAGLFPVLVTEIAAATSGSLENLAAAPAPVPRHWPRLVRWALRRRLKPEALAAFTRQLATLVGAGVPLSRAVRVLQRQQANPDFVGVLGDIVAAVGAGKDLSSALREHPRWFPPLYASLVRAGEASGRLAPCLEQLAQLLEKAERLRARVRAALYYPAVVSIVTAAIVTGLLVFVVPRFQTIFSDLLRGAPLPALTRAVLAVSAAIREQVGLVAAATVVAVLLLRWFRRTRGWDRLVLGLPWFGTVVRKGAVARAARTLGSLLAGGVPILQALNLARETVDNAVLGEVFAVAHDRVRDGQPLFVPLAASPHFPALAASMVEVGEETGELPAMLERVAESYENEVDQAAAGLTSVIEPLLIVVLAAVVGTIVVALFLPIIRILQLLSGG